MELPSNSHNIGGKPEKSKKEIQKVISGEAIVRQKPLGTRFKGLFFGGEFRGAITYIFQDVLLPAFKNVIVDATSKGIERVVYGETAPRRRFDPRAPLVSYNRPVDRGSNYRSIILPDQAPRYPVIPQRKREAGDIILASKEDAENVLDQLTTIIEQYDVASVADLKELVGLPSTYVDNAWGWSSMAQVKVMQVRDGFLIDLPPVTPINTQS